MSSYSHVFIDWDETCFEHYKFLGWLEEFAAETGVLDPRLLETADKYHDQKGENLRLYRHRDHVADALGLEWEYFSGEVERAVAEQELDFCYPDAHAFLEQAAAGQPEARILTYGDGEYQRFKIGTCQVVRDLRLSVHVVQEPKADFLSRHFGESMVRGVLVDDKHPLHLPPNWAHLWLDREAGLREPQPGQHNTTHISNLIQAAKLIS